MAAAAAIFSGCTKPDGTDEISKPLTVDEMCSRLNEDIASILVITGELGSNGFIKTIKPLGGTAYTVTFNGVPAITVRKGTEAGVSYPALAAKADKDGLYYWTLDGEWLLDGSGSKMLLKDRKLSINAEGGQWNIVSDDGKFSMPLNPAVVEDDCSMFRDVISDDLNVRFVFRDGSELVAPRLCPLNITFDKESPLDMDPNSTFEVGYSVKSSVSEVTVKAVCSDDLEAEAVPGEGLGGKIIIKSGNVIDNTSQVKVSVTDGRNTISKTLSFLPAEAPFFELITREANISAVGNEFKVTVWTNTEYTVSGMPDWIKEVNSERNAETRRTVHTFRSETNTMTEIRSGSITFSNANQESLSASVIQKEWIDFSGKSFFHRSVAMRFTADWCGFCPAMASAFDKAEKDMPGKLEIISMHCDGALTFNKSAQLMGQFNIGGFPTGIIDGRRLVENYPTEYIVALTKEYCNETETAYPSASGIGMSSVLEGDNLTVNVEAYLKYPESYLITAMVLEDKIVGYQANFETGDRNDYVHNGVPRIALTKSTGDSFSTTSANDAKGFTYSCTIPANCKAENMRVVVYIQRAFGSQTRLQDGQYGDYYIDNCISGKVGSTVDLKFAGN